MKMYTCTMYKKDFDNNKDFDFYIRVDRHIIGNGFVYELIFWQNYFYDNGMYKDFEDFSSLVKYCKKLIKNLKKRYDFKCISYQG